jgi:hypothetical protein
MSDQTWECTCNDQVRIARIADIRRIPDDLLTSEYQRRRASKRTDAQKRMGGRPRKMNRSEKNVMANLTEVLTDPGVKL